MGGHWRGTMLWPIRRASKLYSKFYRTFSRVQLSSKPKKHVYVSTSRDIFDNLALEEWLYENADLSGTDYLLIWRNVPALVIGRHQNPWIECNILEAHKRGVAVARRNSGGGTVYHDEGNINLSFLKARSRYDRRENLSLVVHALTACWDIDLDLNKRDDLILDGIYKVSGTASKLGGQKTYHHFTLLLDVDTQCLAHLLHSPLEGVKSKSTSSVPALVRNLKEAAPDMTAEDVILCISKSFLKDEPNAEQFLQSVDPSDDAMFPGVHAIRQRLKSWEWVYGKTPQFSITRTFVRPLSQLQGLANPPQLSTPAAPALQAVHDLSMKIHLVIDKGRISSIAADLAQDFDQSLTGMDCSALSALQAFSGEPLAEEHVQRLWESMEDYVQTTEAGNADLLMWGVKCLKQCLPCPGR